MSSKHDPCRPIHFLVLHANTSTPPPGSSSHASVPDASSAFGTVSADEGSRDHEPLSPTTEGAQRCSGDAVGGNEWLGTAASICHSAVYGEDNEGARNGLSEEQGGCRHSSLVRMRLNLDTALPPALDSKKSAADILKEVWHCSETPLPLAVRTQGIAHQGDASKHRAISTQASVSPTELNDLIHELISIGFASAREQELLRTSPLTAWARILPSVTARYCQRRYALDVNNHKGADFMLCRHQNGLLMLGLAPTHYILEEARRRRKALREDTGSAAAGSYSLATTVPDNNHSEATLPAATDENPLLGEDGDHAHCMNPLSMKTEQRGGAQHDDSDQDKKRLSGSILKVKFKQELLGCTASGKRKRGGAQLHLRMRLGVISLQESFSAELNSPPESSALGSGVAGDLEKATCEAPIFGCLTGELLEVNEALNNDADVLLEPGWGIFVEEQEAFASRPHLLSFHEKP
ncbi:hypothetical protein Emed_002328 [Eimeria media]